MIKAFQNAFKIPELRQRIIFTALLLIVYRLGAHITLPGIDDIELEKFFDNLRGRTGGSVLDFVDLFSGGAFKQMTIFALGIQPYISASIVMQLLTVVIPFLEKLSKEPDGRKKITQYTRYATVILSAIQGIMISLMLQRPGAVIRSENIEIVTNPGIWWTLLTMITLMAGTSFVMWLGEQITERGIGQGISLIITIGILSGMPGGIQTIFNQLLNRQIDLPKLVIFLALGVVAIMGTVYITFCVRKIPVQYARRVVGRKVMGGASNPYPPACQCSRHDSNYFRRYPDAIPFNGSRAYAKSISCMGMDWRIVGSLQRNQPLILGNLRPPNYRFHLLLHSRSD